jgi:hypothetical protein
MAAEVPKKRFTVDERLEKILFFAATGIPEV